MSECNDGARLLDGLQFIENSKERLQASFQKFEPLLSALIQEEPYKITGALLILDEGDFYTIRSAVKPATFESSHQMYEHLLNEFSDQPDDPGWDGIAVHFAFFAAPVSKTIAVYSIHLNGVGIVNLHVDEGWHEFDAHPPMLEQLIAHSMGIGATDTKSLPRHISQDELAEKYADNPQICAAIFGIQKANEADNAEILSEE